jgi:hypothetical protein
MDQNLVSAQQKIINPTFIFIFFQRIYMSFNDLNKLSLLNLTKKKKKKKQTTYKTFEA